MALLFLAAYLARRELRLYRASEELGSEIFEYSRSRLYRRLIGVAILVILAVTLVLFGAYPPQDHRAATRYLTAILAELSGLILLPLWDLWETGRTNRRSG